MQYKFIGKFMNDSVFYIYININIEIITLSSDYYVFMLHKAVYHTGPCNCVELPDHLQHRIWPSNSISRVGFYH